MTETRKVTFKSFGCKTEKEVLDIILDPGNGIEFVRVMFPDILGRPMDFAFPSSELGKAFQEGKGFDGSSIEGFVRIEESDLVIKPDPATFRVLPWEYKGFDDQVRWREAILFGDILTPEGEPYEGDSRQVLKKALRKGREEFGIDGYKCGPELEFFIFPSDKEATLTDEGGYFFSGRHGELRKEIQLHLKNMGIESEFDHHEAAPSQHEIDLKYTTALEMADSAMLFRYMVKKVARMHGLYATFMPKPINGINGSGMHVHQSLWKKGKNVFFDPKESLSPFGDRQVIYGRIDDPRPGNVGRPQPVGELLQAAHRRLRSAGLRGLGPEEQVGLHPGPRIPAGKGTRDTHRAPLPRPRMQHLPRAGRHVLRRPERDQGRGLPFPPPWKRTFTR